MKNLPTNILPGVASTVKPYHIRQSIHQDDSFWTTLLESGIVDEELSSESRNIVTLDVISSSLRKSATSSRASRNLGRWPGVAVG